MKPALWRKIEELFHRTLEVESSRRPEFLKNASQGDEKLRAEVESLLQQEETTREFLETPALEVAAKSLADSRSELNGKILGGYQVEALLGAGGTAVVYKARHSKLGQLRALKILPPEIAADRTRMRRFRREAKAVAKLSHPNIARVYEVAEEEGIHFIVLEYVEGKNLSTTVAGGPLPISDVILIARQVAAALEHAHSRRIVHRDIKLSNIMLTPERGVKVLDFGLAKIRRSEEDAEQSSSTDTLTQPGVVMGTMGYMSPEQLLGKELDHRTDIFSLGVVIYNMATGNLPFLGRTISDQMDRILNAQPEALTRFNQEVPEKLELIVRKCLQKNSKQRYKSCSTLLADLSSI